jgi:ion channel-forming bestrophin family protein
VGSPKSASFQQQQQVVVQRRSSVNRRRGSFPGGYNHRSPATQTDGTLPNSGSAPNLPLPATSPGETDTKPGKLESLDLPRPPRVSISATSKKQYYAKGSLAEPYELLPARNPPQYSYFDIFPFSLLVKYLTRRGKEVKGKKGARLRAKLRRQVVSHNLPLEISLYLVRMPSQ